MHHHVILHMCITKLENKIKNDWIYFLNEQFPSAVLCPLPQVHKLNSIQCPNGCTLHIRLCMRHCFQFNTQTDLMQMSNLSGCFLFGRLVALYFSWCDSQFNTLHFQFKLFQLWRHAADFGPCKMEEQPEGGNIYTVYSLCTVFILKVHCVKCLRKPSFFKTLALCVFLYTYENRSKGVKTKLLLLYY